MQLHTIPRFAVAGVLLGASAGAQEIRGRVVRPDSVTPASGVVVTAVDARGATAARGITGQNGNYVLQPRAGTYELRALRIGFRPTVVSGVVAAAGATRTVDIVLTALPVALTQVDVRGAGDCSLKGRDAQTYLRLWEQARGALTATSLWEQSGALDVQVVRVEGREDSRVDYTDSVYAEVDTLKARQDIVSRVIAATPSESLLTRGYVRRLPDGRQLFDMPSAEALLSDGFVDTHCFSIERSKDHPDWVGLGFHPRRVPKEITDIKGVLWMERESAELRRLEFDYVNVRLDEYRICDHHPWIPVTPEMVQQVPPFEQFKYPRCSTINDRQVRHLNLGGHADFARLGGGEWLVARWRMRTPPDTAKERKLPWRIKIENRKVVRCYYGSDCHTISTPRPRLVTVEGSVTRVLRDGVELYRDSTASGLVAAMLAKHGGSNPSGLLGTITDAEANPIANAVVQSMDPRLATFTDSSGTFALRTLPPGEVVISVRHRAYQPLQFRIVLRPDSTHRTAIQLLPTSASSPRVP